jgi:hypothetical protein
MYKILIIFHNNNNNNNSYIIPPKNPNFYAFISKNCGECKMQLINIGFNNIHNEWQNSCPNTNSWKEIIIKNH